MDFILEDSLVIVNLTEKKKKRGRETEIYYWWVYYQVTYGKYGKYN